MKLTKKWSDTLLILCYAILIYFTLFFSYEIAVGEEATMKWYAFGIISVIICVISVIYRDDIELEKFTRLLLLFIIYLIVRALLGNVFDIGISYFLLFMVLVYLAKFADYYSVPLLFVTAAAVQSVIGILQYYGLCDSMFAGGVSGTLDNPAGYASCLAIVYPLCFLIIKRSKYELIFGILSMILIVTGVLLSGSRAGMLSIAVVTVIYILASLKRVKLIYIGASIALLGATLASLLLFKIDSIKGRLFIWENSWELIKENFFLGGGYRSFQANYMLQQAEYFKNNPNSEFLQLADNVSHPLNEYLKLFVEYGLVGVILFVAVFVYMIAATKKNNPHMLCLISLAVFAFFSYPLSYPFTIVVIAYCFGRVSDTDTFPDWVSVINVPCKLAVMGFCLMPMSLFYLNVEFNVLWDKAYERASFGYRDALIEEYDTLYYLWNGDPKFLYNYAVELEREAETEKSIMIMNDCRRRINNYDVNIFFGDVYLKNKEYDLAEKYFITAKNMIPNRFLPLGRLLRIYEEQGDNEKAVKIANEILSKEIKIPSTDVSWVIIEAKRFIEKQ